LYIFTAMLSVAAHLNGLIPFVPKALKFHRAVRHWQSYIKDYIIFF